MSSEKHRRPKVWNCTVAEYRSKLGLTLDEVAKGAGVGMRTVCYMEDGNEVSLTTATKTAKFFGVSIEKLWPSWFVSPWKKFAPAKPQGYKPTGLPVEEPIR